jgi:hypothetical protein
MSATTSSKSFSAPAGSPFVNRQPLKSALSAACRRLHLRYREENKKPQKPATRRTSLVFEKDRLCEGGLEAATVAHGHCNTIHK